MTFEQIKKIRDLLKKADDVVDFCGMGFFLSELRGFFGESTPNLIIMVHNTESTYNDYLLAQDKIQIKAFLESELASCNEYTKVSEILDYLEDGEKIKTSDKNAIKSFISKIYHGYYGQITFDKAIENLAIVPDYLLPPMNDGMLLGVLKKLKDYAVTLLSPKQIKKEQAPLVQISNNNTAMATVNVDISFSLERARNQIEDAGLSDEQHKEVMNKLSEIEEIAKSKESNGKRWQRAKGILKWIAEQGITVAGIVLPLLAPMIG